MTQRLLFFSNLFPTVAEPYRGLDNATLLHALSAEMPVRVLSPRPALPWARPAFQPRPSDLTLEPRWVPCPYLPKMGGLANHILMAAALRRQFEQLLDSFQPTAILSSWIFPDCIAALRLARGRLPVVAISQGSDIHHYLLMSLRRRIILSELPVAAAVITRSHDLGRILSSADFPQNRLHTIYNGVDLETFQPRNPLPARREAGLPESGPIILFVGNFFPVKNPTLLIRALAQIPASPEAPGGPTLVMAGGGPLEKPCRALAAQLGLAQRVIFAGRQAPAGIARLMNAADLLALPSRNEGVPNVILEAFASGLPVVSSHVGGIPEVLSHPFLGRTVPSGDLPALAAALALQLAARRDIAAIRAHGETFSWPRAASQYHALIDAAVRAHAAP